MDFSNLLQRASLLSVERFFMYGGENMEKPSGKTYSQRLLEVRKKATAFLRGNSPI